MEKEIAILVIILLIIILIIGLVIFLVVYNKRYTRFVVEHAISLKKLDEINKKYKFYKIPSYDMWHSYDNHNFYHEIYCRDYLIYQLVYIKNKVSNSIECIYKNRVTYKYYKEKVDSITFGEYDTSETLGNINKLNRIEKKLFMAAKAKPTTQLIIKVTLRLTNINGKFLSSKSASFTDDEINTYIGELNRKRGYYYENKDIWDAICRVERGKVTNKMRFAIYKRDGYRCRRCGRKTNDLEIDHIIPIARGGKSTFDNLQTLCKRCNRYKGTDTFRY